MFMRFPVVLGVIEISPSPFVQPMHVECVFYLGWRALGTELRKSGILDPQEDPGIFTRVRTM